jgi:tetratricopeptide (TPR) repeat protein
MWFLSLPAALALACSTPASTASFHPEPGLEAPPNSQDSMLAAPEFRDVEGSAQLTEQGWQLIPTYTGEHRWSLSNSQRARTLAGFHVLSAATALDPANHLAWWRRGHAATLLSNDDRARSGGDGHEFTRAAYESLTRARELSPDDPWSAYALGLARADLGDLDGAVRGLNSAIELCAPGIAAEGPDGTSAWIAFKCREWLGELLMRAGRFDEARASLRSFYADFGENAWPLRIALGECALRQRDFAAAREQYTWIVEQGDFAGDPQAHAMLGYLAGLLGHTEAALAHLNDAIARERTPELYARLWQWILDPETPSERRPDLEKFLAFPPPQLPPWDLRLGRFLLGEGSPTSLLDAARIELERRWEANENPGDLMCEAQFYTGLRFELNARAAASAESRRESWTAARVHYGAALRLRPTAWKWEWAYARLRDAQLSRALDARRERQTWESFETSDFERIELHRLSAEAPIEWSPAGGHADSLEVGDLLLAYRAASDSVPAIEFEPSANAHPTSYRLLLVR